MHIYEPACGFLGTNGIVGAGIPIGAGAALGAQIRRSGQITVSFFGDGAVNNCAFHEGINLAAIWDLPVVFVCENNMYATEMPFKKATRNTDVATRGVAYGIPGVAVDGNDVLAVHGAAADAVDRARSGRGPTLIECKTYRTVGHFEGDPGVGYRSRDEIAEWKKRDPIAKLRNESLSAGAVTPQQLDLIDREAADEVAEAYEFARASSEADPRTVTSHVYA
jgi:TPP-dependent pyruvate/acetoin dehydrogenase alpha subunit